MNAISANDANEEGGEKSEEEAGVSEGQGHGEDARAQAALEQVHQSVHVRGRMGQLSVHEGIVQGSLLVIATVHQRQSRAIGHRDWHLVLFALVSAKPNDNYQQRSSSSVSNTIYL